eukprot:12360399-Alexandrium_andersonii.AAC.1
MHAAVGSGALWCGAYACKAGYARDASCDKCGHRNGTIAHTFWECPETRRHWEVVPLTAEE